MAGIALRDRPMPSLRDVRVASLVPSLTRGHYWQPAVSEFARLYPQTTVFTGAWPGYVANFESPFAVQVVGHTRFVEIRQRSAGYSRGFLFGSPSILSHLARFHPHVVFASAFSIWTVLVLLGKAWGRWRVVIGWDGSSPHIDQRDALLRLGARRLMARCADAFITNSRGGEAYLTNILGAKESQVFTRPYQVPCPRVL